MILHWRWLFQQLEVLIDVVPSKRQPLKNTPRSNPYRFYVRIGCQIRQIMELRLVKHSCAS
jgi:hypothetical protein